jgi:hypothetical protein
MPENTAPTSRPIFCVVVSSYDARPASDLHALLEQLHLAAQANDSKAYKLRVIVSVNHDPHGTLPDLPSSMGCFERIVQVNQGFNMGAWQHGWQHGHGARHFLFLQDECRMTHEGSLDAYWAMLEREPMCLAGESLQRWNGWRKYARQWPECTAIVEKLAVQERIPLGASASHLQTLALGASAQGMNRLGGFLMADEKVHAIATEVLLSRKALALGLKLRQSAARPFSHFAHDQWSSERERSTGWAWRVRQLVWQCLPV